MTHAEMPPSKGWYTHEWFYWKDDKFRCCKKCGNIERADKQSGECKGKVKIVLRAAASRSGEGEK